MSSKKKSLITSALAILVPVGLIVWLVAPTNLFAISLIKAFLVQILWGLPILAIIFFLVNWKKLALGTFLSSVVLLLYLIPYLWPEQENREDVPADLTMAQFNLSRKNKKYDAVIDLIKSSNADIISIQEINSEWIDKLEARLEKDYMFSLSRPDETGFYGIAIFSKYPAEFEEVDLGILPNIEAVCQTPFGKISVLSSHMHTPTLSENYHRRNAHLKEVGEWADSQNNPVITIGDYNTVPWDSHLLELKETSGLNQSRVGWQPTFPSYLPPAMIPLDYILYSDDFNCLGFETVSIPESDHYGVIGRYQIKANKNQNAELAR